MFEHEERNDAALAQLLESFAKTICRDLFARQH